MKPNNIQAVVLSLDGIVLDTYSHLEKTFTSILEQHNLEPQPYFFELYVDGGFQNRHRSYIHYNQFEPLKDDMRLAFENSLEQLIQDNQVSTLLNPSIESLIDTLHQKNIKYGLVSSLNSTLTNKLIEKLPFQLKYEALVSGNEIMEGKPEKDIYSKIAKKLQINPHEILAIDASVNGVLASYLANMNNIYVETYKKSNEKARKYSNRQVKNLQALVSLI